MSCGNTSCPDQLDRGDAGSGSNIGFLQVMPNEFTRKELQALLRKTLDLLRYGVPTVRDIEREFLECMAEDLDMLDALKARKEKDLAGLEETLAEHYSNPGPPRIVVEPRMPGPLPSCSPDCPFHSRIRT